MEQIKMNSLSGIRLR